MNVLREMMKMIETSDKIVELLLMDIKDRRGLRQAYENFDPEIQKEIQTTWNKEISEILDLEHGNKAGLITEFIAGDIVDRVSWKREWEKIGDEVEAEIKSKWRDIITYVLPDREHNFFSFEEDAIVKAKKDLEQFDQKVPRGSLGLIVKEIYTGAWIVHWHPDLNIKSNWDVQEQDLEVTGKKLDLYNEKEYYEWFPVRTYTDLFQKKLIKIIQGNTSEKEFVPLFATGIMYQDQLYKLIFTASDIQNKLDEINKLLEENLNVQAYKKVNELKNNLRGGKFMRDELPDDLKDKF